MPMTPPIYGLLAEFNSPAELVHATRCARKAGYKKIEAYTPFPIEGLREELGRAETKLPIIVLLGGLVGAAVGYFIQYFTNVIDYPLNVGGRPLHSWPAFIVIAFEMAILIAGLAAVFGMLALNKLPMPYHPIFNVHHFSLADRNKFFLCLRWADDRFDPEHTRRFLAEFKPLGVWEVPH